MRMREYIRQITSLYELFRKFICIEFTETVADVFYYEKEQEHHISREDNRPYQAMMYNDFNKGIFITMYDNGSITVATTSKFPVFIINSTREEITIPGIHGLPVTVNPGSYILFDPGR